jgi:hypothetical protein
MATRRDFSRCSPALFFGQISDRDITDSPAVISM